MNWATIAAPISYDILGIFPDLPKLSTRPSYETALRPSDHSNVPV